MDFIIVYTLKKNLTYTLTISIIGQIVFFTTPTLVASTVHIEETLSPTKCCVPSSDGKHRNVFTLSPKLLDTFLKIYI